MGRYDTHDPFDDYTNQVCAVVPKPKEAGQPQLGFLLGFRHTNFLV